MTKAHDSNNVAAYSPKATGGVLAAKLGTALPTDVKSDLGPEFHSLGYVSEDGVTESISRDIEKKKAWGGATVKILTTDHSATWQLQLMETANVEAMKAVYGEDAVDTSGDTPVIKVSATELPEMSIVFDMYDKSNGVGERIVIPRGRVTEMGDLIYTHGDISVYEVTIEALEDEDGHKAYKYKSPNAPATDVVEPDSSGPGVGA